MGKFSNTKLGNFLHQLFWRTDQPRNHPDPHVKVTCICICTFICTVWSEKPQAAQRKTPVRSSCQGNLFNFPKLPPAKNLLDFPKLYPAQKTTTSKQCFPAKVPNTLIANKVNREICNQIFLRLKFFYPMMIMYQTTLIILSS